MYNQASFWIDNTSMWINYFRYIVRILEYLVFKDYKSEDRHTTRQDLPIKSPRWRLKNVS